MFFFTCLGLHLNHACDCHQHRHILLMKLDLTAGLFCFPFGILHVTVLILELHAQ
jgi:hypothetical protein